MNRLYIFGDSFSADFNRTDYYNKEIEKGYIGKYKNLRYYFQNKIGKKVDVINTAFCGSSNDKIFENFTIHSLNFRPDDYISFQTSFYFRFRLITKNNVFIDINPHDFSNNSGKQNFLKENVKNFNIEEIKKLIIEHNEEKYLIQSINFIKMVRNLCILSKTNFHIWSLDDNLNCVSTSSINIINNQLLIKNKYPEINDIHPSFEGNEFIIDSIVNNWETYDNNKKNKII